MHYHFFFSFLLQLLPQSTAFFPTQVVEDHPKPSTTPPDYDLPAISTLATLPSLTGPRFSATGTLFGGDIAQVTHLAAVCEPRNSSGYLNLNAPCNAAMLLTLECVFGAGEGLKQFEAMNEAQQPDIGNPSHQPRDKKQLQSLHKLNHHQQEATAPFPSYPSPPSPLALDPNTQRICACSSQLLPQLLGCALCNHAHGATIPLAFIASRSPSKHRHKDFLDTVSSSYCAVSTIPTAGLMDILQNLADPDLLPASLQTSLAKAGSSTYSDPLGTSTEVSLYWTPSITGTAAWAVGEPIETGVEEVQTVKGEVVATAQDGYLNGTGGRIETSRGGQGRNRVGVLGFLVIAFFNCVLLL